MFGSSADDLVLRPPVVLSGEQQRGTTWSGDGGGVGGGVAEQAGLVPRCCSQLLEGIRRRRQLLGADSGTSCASPHPPLPRALPLMFAGIGVTTATSCHVYRHFSRATRANVPALLVTS